MINPVAYFDALSLCVRLSKRLTNAAEQEIHLFSYLACLLWLYQGKPVALWGYTYAVTADAYPYSPQIHDALSLLETGGLITSHENILFAATPEGARELEALESLPSLVARASYLDGATSSLIVYPVNVVRGSLQRERSIQQPSIIKQSKALLTPGDVERLYEEFTVLSQAIGIDVNDLMLPAVVWIEYLSAVTSITE